MDVDWLAGRVGGRADRDDLAGEESDDVDGFPVRVDRNAKGPVAVDVDWPAGRVGGGADRDYPVVATGVDGLAIRRDRHPARDAETERFADRVGDGADRDDRGAGLAPGRALVPDVDGGSGQPVLCWPGTMDCACEGRGDGNQAVTATPPAALRARRRRRSLIPFRNTLPATGLIGGSWTTVSCSSLRSVVSSIASPPRLALVFRPPKQRPGTGPRNYQHCPQPAQVTGNVAGDVARRTAKDIRHLLHAQLGPVAPDHHPSPGGQRGQCIKQRHPVPLENRIRYVTCGSSMRQAACDGF